MAVAKLLLQRALPGVFCCGGFGMSMWRFKIGAVMLGIGNECGDMMILDRRDDPKIVIHGKIRQ